MKDYSKGTGFIKDEHKFSTNPNQEEAKRKEVNFLNYEEADNLQDMINFAASINQKDKNQNIYPIESLYSQVLNSPPSGQPQIYTNERIDKLIEDCLKSREMDDSQKINKSLDLSSQLLRMRNKNLSEATYVGLVELFMKNGYLSHASYFLCQMDRLKMKIPRSLLDLFLDYSINNKLFESKESEEITFKNTNYDSDRQNNKYQAELLAQNLGKNSGYNKYDEYDPQSDPDYAYYFRRRNQYKERKDIHSVFSNLKLNANAKPFYPKKVEDEEFDKIKNKLSEIDPSKVKEFIPKNYKVVKKEDQ